MTDELFNKVMHGVVADIRSMTPVGDKRRDPHSGNLKINATNGGPAAHGTFVITVDASIAPYFVYVNNYQRHRYRDRGGNIVEGRSNRNYHYFQKALTAALEKIGTVEGEMTDG